MFYIIERTGGAAGVWSPAVTDGRGAVVPYDDAGEAREALEWWRARFPEAELALARVPPLAAPAD